MDELTATGSAHEGRLVGAPKRSPAILALANQHITWVSFLLGVGAGLASAYYINHKVDKSSTLFKIHDFEVWHSAIPISILCIFCWGLFICFFRWWRVGALKSVSSPKICTAATAALIRTEDVQSLEAELASSPVKKSSPFFRRALAILEQWRIKPGLTETHLVLTNQNEIDAEMTYAGYSLVRTFIWALPVIGLVGTVLGISDAVGGFATFLGGDVEEVSEIKRNLADVTGGLSFAFSITLEGLATSLILMLIASGLQTREEGVFYRTQSQISDTFIPALQLASPVSDIERDEALPEAIQKLKQLIDHQIAAIKTIDEHLEASGQKILTVVDALNKTIPGSVAVIDELTKRLEDQQPIVKEVAEANGKTAAKLPAILTAQEDLNNSIIRLEEMGLNDTLSALNSSLNKLSPILDKFSRPFEFKVGLGESN